MRAIFSFYRSAARWIATLFLGVMAMPQANATSPVSVFRVRPCTTQESAVASSAEFLRLITHNNRDEKQAFNWCEALDVTWLPNASILRFHSPIHVDYAYAVTIIKSTTQSPMRLIGFGEGMVQQPSPNQSGSLAAMNELLESAQAPFNRSRLESACILYLFMLGRETRHELFRKPEVAHSLSASDYRFRELRNGVFEVVTTGIGVDGLRMSFSAKKGLIHLDSVSDVLSQ
jgi:hypothetical protein